MGDGRVPGGCRMAMISPTRAFEVFVLSSSGGGGRSRLSRALWHIYVRHKRVFGHMGTVRYKCPCYGVGVESGSRKPEGARGGGFSIKSLNIIIADLRSNTRDCSGSALRVEVCACEPAQGRGVSVRVGCRTLSADQSGSSGGASTFACSRPRGPRLEGCPPQPSPRRMIEGVALQPL